MENTVNVFRLHRLIRWKYVSVLEEYDEVRPVWCTKSRLRMHGKYSYSIRRIRRKFKPELKNESISANCWPKPKYFRMDPLHDRIEWTKETSRATFPFIVYINMLVVTPILSLYYNSQHFLGLGFWRYI